MERMATDLTLKVVCILVALGSIHSEVCPDGWFMWMNTTCYYLSPRTYTRPYANNSCPGMDSHLAHIESDDENTFLAELLKKNHLTAAWIGLWKAEKDLSEGITCDLSCRRQGWTWSGNASINLSKMEPKWNQGEPSGGNSCARLEKTGDWWDTHCSTEYKSICEKTILHQTTPAAGMPDAPTTIEGNSESRQPQNTSETTSGEATTSRAIDSTRGYYTSMAPEGGSPNNLPIIIGAAVGGVLLGVLITGIVFIVVYRRKKRNRQIKRSEPTKHRSGLSAQDNRVVSGYDSKATNVNEIPCVALATTERPNKASYVNGFDVNALTNEYDNPAEKKKAVNQNTSTSNDDGAYATINEIETSFPDVIPQKAPAVKATPKLHVPMKPKFIKSVSTESVESIAGSVGSMGSMGSVGSIATECGIVEQLYAVVDKSKKKKKQTNEEIEQMYAKPMKKNKNDFSSDEK